MFKFSSGTGRRLLLPVLLMLVLCACSSSDDVMHDGYYTAEAAEYDAFGWKEFVAIYVKDDVIISVEYEAKNASGFIKSWDMNYMRVMNSTDGTYPKAYTRIYSNAFLNSQNPDEVDAVSGATTSHTTFQILARAAMELAKSGESGVVLVDIPSSGH